MTTPAAAPTPTTPAATPAPAAPSVSAAATVATPAPASDTALTPPTDTNAGKEGAQPGAEAAPTEKPDAKPDAEKPADLDIKLPEGVQADAVSLDEFKALAKETGLKGEVAQKMVDLHLKAMSAAEARGTEAYTQQQKVWADQRKSDKEYGGTNYEANLKTAQQAVAKFASPEFRQFLAASKLGNHPELVRAFYRVGKAMAEDSVAGATSEPAGPPSEESKLRARYPSLFPNSQE